MTTLSPALLGSLVRSVALLSLPSDDQILWLNSLGLGVAEYADELASELEAGAVLVQQFESLGWVSTEACRAVQNLDAALAENSEREHGEFWRLESLRDSPEWARIRRLAVVALFAF